MRRSGEEQKESAASDIIAFIMILFIIVVAVAGWMLYVIPSQGNEAETSHNEKVLLEFTGLKGGIDTLWMNGLVGYSGSYLVSMSPSERTSLSTLLYLAPTLGSGMLKVENGTTLNLTDTRENITYTYGKYNYLFSQGNSTNITLLRLTYESSNQYAQNFIITYEGGVVWYSSDSGATYELLSPTVDNKNPKETIMLLARAPEAKDSTLLGTLPVTVNYQYHSTIHSYPDARKLENGKIVYNVSRSYIELYKPLEDSDVYPASNSLADKYIAEYWKKIINNAKTTYYDGTTIDGYSNGAKIMVNYYNLGIVAGGI